MFNINILARTREWVGLRKFVNVYSHEGFQNAVRVTVTYVFLIVPALMVLSLIIANIIFNLKNALAVNIASTTFILPIIASMVAAGMIWDWLLDPTLGLVNNALDSLGIQHSLKWLRSSSTVLISVVIIGVWIRVGFDVMIFVGGLQSIPEQYFEAAQIDGASDFDKFFRITFPLLNPQIIMVLTIELIFAFKAFDHIYVITKGGPAASSKTVMILLIKDIFRIDYGAACAITVTLLVFLLFISYLQRRFLRRSVEF
jgi:ABC-type sugar transport system permease subunit